MCYLAFRYDEDVEDTSEPPLEPEWPERPDELPDEDARYERWRERDF